MLSIMALRGTSSEVLTLDHILAPGMAPSRAKAQAHRELAVVQPIPQMMARTMRKMQVPAYSPAVEGAHWLEKSGVLWSLVKAMGMECDMLLLDDEEEPISMLDMSWLL